MEKIKCYLLILVLVLIFSGTVGAIDKNPNQLLQEAPNQFYYPDKDAVVWKEEKVFDYSKQPYKASHYRAIKIFNQQGAEEYSQVKINYHPQWHELNITTALVIKPSGKLVTIEQEQIKDKPIKYSPNSNLYQSQYQKIINVPQVEAGAILIYAYQKQLKKLQVPKEIQFSTTVNSHQSEVVLKVPQDREVNTKIKPNHELNQAVISKQENIKKYTWSGYKSKAEILVSTLDSWHQVSEWYNKLITNQGELSQSLKKRIANLTRGLKTKQAQIRVLYNYVAENIRYLDYKLGVNGYQPLTVEDIHKRKYAVAKDKIYFLSALLKEINVESEPILINRKKNFDAGIVVTDFDQMLLYLPEQDLYLDPNSGFVRYGNLPLSEQGKRALSLARGQIKRTPILPKEKNQEQVKAKIDLENNGAAHINLKIKSQGFYDFIAKALFGSLSPIGQKKSTFNILTKYFQKPELKKTEINGVKKLAELSDLNLAFTVKNYYQVQDGQAIIEPNQLPISFLLSVAEAKNTLPCKIKRQVIINVPEQYDKIILPKNKNFSNHEGELMINYQKNANQIIINFSYQFNRLAGVERVSWVYINDLLDEYQNIKQQKILLEINKKNNI